MEFIIGAVSAVGAGCFTNPLEVVKTRIQLQGELKKKGNYVVHYKNFLHAFYIIGKTEGIFAIQKGLAPALAHQVVLNGVRLGGYQMAEERGWNLNREGQLSMLNTVGIGAVMGAAGALIGSPLYLVKTRLQSQAGESIAVGHQHKVEGTVSALKTAYREGGLGGLWRGAGGSLPRMMVGSASQLTSFYVVKEYLANNKVKYLILFGKKWAIDVRICEKRVCSRSVSVSMRLTCLFGNSQRLTLLSLLGRCLPNLFTSCLHSCSWNKPKINHLLRDGNCLFSAQHYVIPFGLLNTFIASMVGGVVVAFAMGPLDVISTRLYNQGVDQKGRGLLYDGYIDCVKKMWKTEGLAGFYKGIVPCYVRIGPHTVLCFVFWDQLKQLQRKLTGQPPDLPAASVR
ncbi:unnamed protein product [Nesidiocoris tenuis]|uniref:Solute carrier family 25 member 35 n=1 Tax=Nesidiocoris tenuis TaxID=355587 RepID=A0A6H5GI12_9HEMI|nr:unnamed protein product [Nesidiocoris tenuis]